MNKIESIYDDYLTELNRITSIINYRKNRDIATNPLLLKYNNSYENAQNKIMLFGQETNFWYKELNEGIYTGIKSDLLNLYNEFFWEDGCYEYGRRYGGMWRGVEAFFDILDSNKSINYQYIWNNLIKIGKTGKGRPDFYNEIKDINRNIIKQEVDILKPNLVIFFSGPNYDDIITDVFGNIEDKTIFGYTSHQIRVFSVNSIPAIRTYHPGYLLRQDYQKFYKDIIKYAKENNLISE